MKRLFSILLVTVLILCSVSMAVYAIPDENTMFYQSDIISAIEFDPTTVIEYKETAATNENIFTANKFFSDNADSPYTFYSFLDTDQKALYDAVMADPFQMTYTISLESTIEDNCTENSNGEIVLTEEISNRIYQIAIGALSSVCDDHPDIFWIKSFTFGLQFGYYGSGDSDAPYHVIIDEITFITYYDTSIYADVATLRSLYNQINSIADAFVPKGTTRYEKVKSINDYLCDLITYDLNAAMAHEATGVFIAPYRAVCEGYAEAFKMLCDRAGIPSVIIVGYANKDPINGGHAWNYVKMDDNKWYAIDTTWNDAVTAINYNYFIIGAESTFTGSSSTTFTDNHTSTGRRYPFEGFSLTYPTLSTTAYSRMIPSNNSKATVNKKQNGNYAYILSRTTVRGSFSAPYGYTIPYISSQTGSTMNINTTGGTTVETYTVVMRGDIVINGTADTTDYNKIFEILRGADSLSEGSAQFEAADMNSDGVIDVIDAFYIDKTINGHQVY